LAVQDDLLRYDMVGPEATAAPEEVAVQLVSGEYFDVLDVRPALGRAFGTSDDTAADPGLAVLSDAFWTRRFARDPAVIGETITVKRQVLTVIGVAPAGFFGERVGQVPDVWVPLHMQARFESASLLGDPRTGWLRVIGRLRNDVADTQATAVLESFLDRVDPGMTHVGAVRFIDTLRLSDGSRGLDDFRERFSMPLRILSAMVLLVLLVACANVSNLLLARATTRRREVGVRLAIGASRGRLIRQFLAESVLLAGGGGMLGVVIAAWGAPALLALASDTAMPIRTAVSLDMRVLGFTIAMSLSVVVLFGLMPAFDAARVNVSESLKPNLGSGSRGSASLILVVAQISLSLVLLMGAALFLRTLHNLLTRDLGYPIEALLQVRMRPQQSGYEPKQIASLSQRLLERIAVAPGVQAVAHATAGYGTGMSRTCCFAVNGYSHLSSEDREIATVGVDADYFSTMRIPLLFGRSFSLTDLTGNQGRPSSIIVNDTFARRYLQGGEPIGRRIGWGNPPNVTYGMEVIGVAGDAVYNDPRQPARPLIYLPSDAGAVLLVRTVGPPEEMVALLTREIRLLEPGLEFSAEPGPALLARGLTRERALSLLASVFGAVTVILAGVGLYGLMSYGVSRRTREIGLRMALGAGRATVILAEARTAFMLVGWGVGFGLVAALAGASLIRSQLFGVSDVDPVALAGATAVVSVVAALAMWIPAHRASRVDPMVALRQE
jgi:predicted permease